MSKLYNISATYDEGYYLGGIGIKCGPYNFETRKFLKCEASEEALRTLALNGDRFKWEPCVNDLE